MIENSNNYNCFCTHFEVFQSLNCIPLLLFVFSNVWSLFRTYFWNLPSYEIFDVAEKERLNTREEGVTDATVEAWRNILTRDGGGSDALDRGPRALVKYCRSQDERWTSTEENSPTLLKWKTRAAGTPDTHLNTGYWDTRYTEVRARHLWSYAESTSGNLQIWYNLNTGFLLILYLINMRHYTGV